MFRFENLKIWKLSIQYGRKVYRVTNDFPKEELFGLSSQLKRASLSISSNIAEGSGSSTVKDFKRFLDIAIKSVFETVSQIFFAIEMEYIKQEKMDELYSEAEILVKKIHSFKKALNRPSAISN
ncbi:four helix bundle protein [Candidatus Daviesbacteria bacterium]|nr:four helix bundle protein [Candidatus Daviesbacteria bacterium]